MGLGYVDSVIVYNRFESRTEGELYFGTRFDNVRIELTEGANITASGLENASSCVAKIDTASVAKTKKEYKPPKVWAKLSGEEKAECFTLNKEVDFFVIVKKTELGIDVDLPVGKVAHEDYDGYDDGFFEHVKTNYGYAYNVGTVDVYTLIPRFEIGGK